MDCIDKGIEFLDASGPAGWWDLIDLAELNMAAGESCVLGQVFAAQADETGWVSGYHMNLDHMGVDWICAHGFSVNDEIQNWVPLQDAWAEAILDRRALVNA